MRAATKHDARPPLTCIANPQLLYKLAGCMFRKQELHGCLGLLPCHSTVPCLILLTKRLIQPKRCDLRMAWGVAQEVSHAASQQWELILHVGFVAAVASHRGLAPIARSTAFGLPTAKSCGERTSRRLLRRLCNSALLG